MSVYNTIYFIYIKNSILLRQHLSMLRSMYSMR